jgi:hypothetical protein
MDSRYVCALLLMIFIVGCGPTRTAGTNGLAAKDLAVLSIPQLPNVAHVQIDAVQFDGQGDRYAIGNSRDFYLLPGDHSASFSFVADIPGPAGLFVPKSDLKIPGPRHVPLGALSPGKEYELAPTLETFKSLIDGGELSLVREKAK